MRNDVRILLEALDTVAAEWQRSRLVPGCREGGHTSVVVLGVLVVVGSTSVAQFNRHDYHKYDEDQSGSDSDHNSEQRPRK